MGAMPAQIFTVSEPHQHDSARAYFFELEQTLLSEATQRQPIGDVEETLYTGMMELGRRLMQEHIEARGDGRLGDALLRQDGIRFSTKRPGTRHLETLFGEVSIDRVGYRHTGEASIFPKDRQMALPQQHYSYPGQQKVCREAIRSAYSDIDETLSEYTGAHVPKRQSLEVVSQAADDFEAFYQTRSESADRVSDSDQPCERPDTILVHTGDGKGIPMRKEGLREATRKRALKHQQTSQRRSPAEKKHRKREALVASVYTVKPHIRTIDDIMAGFWGEKHREDTSPPRPEQKRVWASVSKEKADIFQEMAEEGPSRVAGVTTAAFLCDGANILQELATKMLQPQFDGSDITFVIILDLLHVLGYLWKAALALFPAGDHQTEAWVGKYLRLLLEGKASVVAGVLRRTATKQNLQGTRRDTVDKAADYFLNNKAYMHYERYLELGLPIASGVIEGACKHLVKDRFEISGARWGLEGAEALLKLRSIHQSGDWQDYWQRHVAREQERLHPPQQWAPVDDGKRPKLTVIQGGKSREK